MTNPLSRHTINNIRPKFNARPGTIHVCDLVQLAQAEKSTSHLYLKEHNLSSHWMGVIKFVAETESTFFDKNKAREFQVPFRRSPRGRLNIRRMVQGHGYPFLGPDDLVVSWEGYRFDGGDSTLRASPLDFQGMKAHQNYDLWATRTLYAGVRPSRHCCHNPHGYSKNVLKILEREGISEQTSFPIPYAHIQSTADQPVSITSTTPPNADYSGVLAFINTHQATTGDSSQSTT